MEFHPAETAAEALDLLAQLGTDARVLAGGTDVMVQFLRGEVIPNHLVYIGRIGELRGVTSNGSTIIGALTTHRTLSTHQVVLDRFRGLAEAAATVGGWQTQAVASVGGNLCNASPAADTVPPLLVADAAVTLVASSGERTMPLDLFLRGRRRTEIRPDELLTSIELPDPAPRSGDVYLKVGPRRAMEVAVVGLAMRLTIDTDEIVTDARVAVCSAAPRPFRSTSGEAVLTGSRLESSVVHAAGEALAETAEAIDDARASASYRRRILPGLLGRAASICRLRALRN